MNCKPVVTYFGAGPLFRSLESHISTSLPLDTAEWKRSFGRPIKNVRLEATFQLFDAKLLEKYKKGEWNILEHPVLHIFITECNDLETYKNSLKDEIDGWLKQLTGYGIGDWMILLVETMDVKKTKNILLRTTVLDKIRLDFAAKHGDRCISVLNPMKFEVKATESFRCLLQRIRYLMLCGYNRNISKYEELIRAHREKRNHEGWNFIQYFVLQEKLAVVLERLGLYQEALIQYDELDAMFSQFILNSQCYGGEKPKWLQAFEKPFISFHGITTNERIICEAQRRVHAHATVEQLTLLEFRSYLFVRQLTLLNLADKQGEIAERLLPFLFATLREINTLKIETLDGSIACWQFVCALEVLNVCEEAVESKEDTNIFQYSGPIWNLAKDKLYELGKLCGLLPGFTPTSQQLHIVVQLSAGMGDNDYDGKALSMIDNSNNKNDGDDTITTAATAAAADANANDRRATKLSDEKLMEKKSHSPNRKPKASATNRLKEALSSNQAFQKLYLELSELAISTYKHVSRLRSARLVGLDLGNFYCTLSEPNKAIVFFTDLLRELKSENWTYLVSQTLLEMASCYNKMNDIVSYTKTCASIACCLELEILVRLFYFDEFLQSLKTMKSQLVNDDPNNNNNKSMGMEKDLNVVTSSSSINNQTQGMAASTTATISFEDHFKLMDIKSDREIILDNYILIEIKFESNFPREIICNRIALSYEPSQQQQQPQSNKSTDNWNSNNTVINVGQLPITRHLEYKQDNTLSKVFVHFDNAKNGKSSTMGGGGGLRRTSSTRRKISSTRRSDFTNCAILENVAIKPGINTIELKSKVTRVGQWQFKQLSFIIEKLEFLTDQSMQQQLIKTKPFEVIIKAPSAILNFKNLVAGIQQPIKLIVSAGSFIFPKDAIIKLKCSKNLKMRKANTNNNLTTIPLDGNAVEEIPSSSSSTPNNDKSITNEFQTELIIDLHNFRSYEERAIDLETICDMPGQRDEKNIEQKVTLHCPWSRMDLQIPLYFIPALIASCRLHSSGTRKFLQVIVKGLEVKLYLSNATMTCDCKGVNIKNCNPKASTTTASTTATNEICIYKGITVSYLWEFEVEPLQAECELNVIKVNFNMEYRSGRDGGHDSGGPGDITNIFDNVKRKYTSKFDVIDYITLFRIQTKIEPSELCRIGSVCHLYLKVIKIQENPFMDLMYEVLADQNWEVCGRRAGVLSMQDSEAQSIALDVMPLSSGFLPMPHIRLSKYISACKTKNEIHPKLQPFPPGQVYNSTKSIQIHVVAGSTQ